MVFWEISARFGISFFLAWCLLAHQTEQAAWRRNCTVLSLVACGFGILADVKGLSEGAVALAILLASTAISMSLLLRHGHTGTAQRVCAWPVVASAVGFFAGQGTILVAVALTLLFLAIERVGISGMGLVKGVPASSSTLRIKAQSIRGIIGRVETVLERLGVKPRYMAVDHDGNEKELTIVTELSLPPGLKLTQLIAALQEVEGVIQFAVE